MDSYKQDVFWANLNSTKNRPAQHNLGFLKKLVSTSFLKGITNPYFIWTGTGRITSLETKIFHPKIKNYLSKSEVYFYLYEPICARIGNYNKSFYSEFDSTENLKDIVCDEIESIKIFVKNHDIKNFRIFTSDYNIQLIKDNYPGIQIDCLDLYLRDNARCHDPCLPTAKIITNKFWCGNWRYTAHRHIVMSYLSQLEGTYTWNLKCSYDELARNGWFNLDKLKEDNLKQYTQLKEGVDYLYNNIFTIDQTTDVVNVDNVNNVFIPGHSAPSKSSKFLDSYKNSFCAIVNETRFAQPFGNFSEKAVTALHSRMPIVLVAPPHTLKYIKTFGFKTFDSWWDESYDKEENHYKRMLKIFDVIDYINSKSINELTSMYNDMKEILEHNHQIAMTIPLNDKIL